ncbi:cyclic nucleotide-binding domain protein, putative (macronuclear) [Tetrahymena thermophila SB210]|uniref:Cyclic nucleotide-binding domain protein, putative n=1 Tax=Tetrahymena thermophila (strain SB210) TaxID=312017 RepID=A4VEY2_TETTS|nr:cyclic nucleotide-binding domain protein, putative [Tetrahymena thermophila SB210]EDK31208.2 cyclic nucleotide-binding domain protein, putative [Tetrahymena thermophila SB210]|eukprot:XP_001471509.2 cyclic nucleotide-binding domain protein, putative [Tetrahymena thermophila SB210]
MNQQTTEFVHTEFDQQYHKIDHLHNDNESFLGSGSQRHISQPLHLITSDDKVSHKELDKHEEQLFDKYTLKRTNSDSAKSANFKQTKILSPKNEKSQESFSQIVHFESEFGLGKKHQDHLGLMHSKNEKRSHLKINYNNLVEDKKSMRNQQFMRNTFKKVRLQLWVKKFAVKMISLLKRNQLASFLGKKEFFHILNDKAAFYNSDLAFQKEIYSLTNRDKKFEQIINSQNLKNSFINLQNKQLSCINMESFQSLFKVLNSIPVISTLSKQKFIWDQIQLLCLGFFFIIIPIIIVFNMTIEGIIGTNLVELFIVVLMIIDVFINFNTSLMQQGKEIKDHYKIAKFYLRNGFCIDIITLICLISYFIVSQQRYLWHVEVISNILLVTFYLRLQQFSRVLKKIEIQYHFSPQISQALRLIKLLLMNIYIIHVLSCLWIQIAYWQYNTNSWLIKFELINQPWYIQFLNSFYFNTVTMVTVGYGDISPQTDLERLFSIFTVLSACCVFAYSISEVGSIFEQMNKANKKQKVNMFIINSYMKKKRITIDLQYQIRHYLEYYWNESFSENTDKQQMIINQLSNNLKENLMLEANRLILESPLFRDNFSLKTLLKTVSIVTEQRCTPEEIIFLGGESDDNSIYFIEKGQVQVFHTFENPNFDSKNQMNVRGRGEYFGEVCFFTGKSRVNNYRSLDFTTLLKIERKKFIEILQENPEDYERFCMIKDDITFNNNIKHTQRKCVYCRDQPLLDAQHIEALCPVLHYIPNKLRLQDSFKHQFNQELRKKHFRQRQFKYNTLGRIEQASGDQANFVASQNQLLEIYSEQYGIIHELEYLNEQDYLIEGQEFSDKHLNQINSRNNLNNISGNFSSSSDVRSSDSEISENSNYFESNNSQVNTPNSLNSIFQNEAFTKKYPEMQSQDRKNSVIQEAAESESDTELSPNLQNLQSPSQASKEVDKLNDQEIICIQNDENSKTVSEKKQEQKIISQKLLQQVNQISNNSPMSQSIEKKHILKHSKTSISDIENNNESDQYIAALRKKRASLAKTHSNENEESFQNRSRKNSQHVQSKRGSKDSEQISHMQNKQQSKSQFNENNFKRRDSKSMQEIKQDRELLKIYMERRKSEKNLSTDSSFSSIKQSHKHDHKDQSSLRFLEYLKKSYQMIKSNPNSENIGLNELIKKASINNQLCLEDQFIADNKNYQNQQHQNLLQFSQQIETLVKNFNSFQENVLSQQNHNHRHHDFTRYQHFKNSKQNIDNFFQQFDQMKSYQIYFPHNNYDYVLSHCYHKYLKQKRLKNKEQYQNFKSCFLQGQSNSSSSQLNEQQSSNSNSNSNNNNNNMNSNSNYAALTDIFGQSSINRLKILMSNTNVRQNQKQDGKSLKQKHKEPSPKNKLADQPQLEEDFKTKSSSTKKNETDSEGKSFQNGFFVGSSSSNFQSENLNSEKQKSRFGIKNSASQKFKKDNNNPYFAQLDQKDQVHDHI